MLDFHAPTFDDKPWVDEVLSCSRHMGCLYSFAQFYLWSKKYNTEIVRVGDCVCILSGGKYRYYVYPAGRYDVGEIIDILAQDAKERGIPLRFCAVEQWQHDELMERFPDRFASDMCRDDCDYIYNASDLINLSGRKYHGKRNHISGFKRAFPDWQYEDITPDNALECGAMLQRWIDEYSGDNISALRLEKEIIETALRDYSSLGLSGGLIRVDGNVIAFTLGERLNKGIYVVHFEKALSSYNGAYPMINHEFAARNLAQYEYINREEDLGLEGLRKSKLSYYPAVILPKYLIAER